jgi:uncharacterized protein YneF (UPF0154 family)
MEFNIGDILIGMGLGFFLSMRVINAILKNLNKKLEEDLGHLRAQAEANIVEAEIHEEKGMYYMFSKEDHKFLAQGKTLTELHEALKARFPEAKQFRVDKIPDALKDNSVVKM